MTPLPEQRKALAGALAGFAAALANHYLDGAPMADVISTGTGLVQLGVGVLLGYLATFWTPNAGGAT